MKVNPLNAESILSNEISTLLHKKNFSKSEFLYLNKKPPQDLQDINSKHNYLLKNFVKHYMLCILILSMYYINIFKFIRNTNKKYIFIFSLTKQQAIRNGSIQPLYKFLKSRNVINESGSTTLVEVRTCLKPKSYKSAKTTIDIPLRIFSDTFPPKKKLKCWILMCGRFFKIAKLYKSNKNSFLILKEYIFDEVVYQNFNSNCVEKLITSQTNIAYQPLIFEYEKMKTKRLMIWYSSNSMPLDYKKKNTQRFEVNPVVYKNMKIDLHWVWTEKHKLYLKQFTQAKILVKQSLMLYGLELETSLNDIFDVVIFDVTPKKSLRFSNDSIYSADEMIKFISEIINCVELIKSKHMISVRVALKHKREFSKESSSEYSQFIRSKIHNNEISILSPNVNLYNLIKCSKLIIGFPFTSPVIIGQEMKKPSIFYCSSDLLKRAPKARRQLFLQSEKSLYTYMTKTLVN